MNHSPNIHAHTKAHILKTGRMAHSTQGFRLTRRTSHRDARPLFKGVRDERLMRTDSICDLWSKSDPWAAHYSPGGLWWTCMCVRAWECELMPLSGSDLSYLCIFSFLWKRKCSLSCRDSHSAWIWMRSFPDRQYSSGQSHRKKHLVQQSLLWTVVVNIC